MICIFRHFHRDLIANGTQIVVPQSPLCISNVFIHFFLDFFFESKTPYYLFFLSPRQNAEKTEKNWCFSNFAFRVRYSNDECTKLFFHFTVYVLLILYQIFSIVFSFRAYGIWNLEYGSSSTVPLQPKKKAQKKQWANGILRYHA